MTTLGFTSIAVSQNHTELTVNNRDHPSKANLRKWNLSVRTGENGSFSLIYVHIFLATVQIIMPFDIAFAYSDEVDGLTFFTENKELSLTM